MTRDELVQAAIEALDADNPGSTYIDTEIDVVDGSLTDVVRAVVDTVLKAQHEAQRERARNVFLATAIDYREPGED